MLADGGHVRGVRGSAVLNGGIDTLIDQPAAAMTPPTPTPEDGRWWRSLSDLRRTGSGRIGRAVVRHVSVIVVFSLPAVALWWHAWDGHLASTVACSCGDSGQEVWFVAWPAYALAHGLDPFFSGQLYAPYGVNLLPNTSAPLVGVVLAPVTWLAGPVAATNVALTLSPALSAWGCWVACRRFAPWWPAAWVGGLLFGYSPFVVTNLAAGHVMVSLLVVPPLLLVAGYELVVARRGSPIRWGAAIGMLVVAQFLISPEVLALTALVGLAGVVLAAALSPRTVLTGWGQLLPGLATAAVVGIGLLAFPAWFLVDGPRHFVGPPWPGIIIEDNRLFDLWNPGHYAATANGLLRLGGYEGRAGPPSVYLGYGVLILAAGSLVAAWRRRLAWWSASMAVVAFVLSLGILLWTSPGHFSTFWLPWRTLGKLPLLEDVIPQRFSALADLFVAVLVAVGLDAAWRRLSGGTREAGRRWRRPAVAVVLLAVAGLALASVWWTYQVPLTTRSVAVPTWFRTTADTIPAGSVVLTYPFPFPTAGTSGPMVWQAEDGMRFRLAGGYAKAPGPDGQPLSNHPHRPPYGALVALSQPLSGPLPKGTVAQIDQLRAALRRWDVSYVVVTDTGWAPAYASTFFTAVVGRAPRLSHQAWVWDLRTDPAAGGRSTAASNAFQACATSGAAAAGGGRGPACVAAHLSAG